MPTASFDAILVVLIGEACALFGDDLGRSIRDGPGDDAVEGMTAPACLRVLTGGAGCVVSPLDGMIVATEDREVPATVSPDDSVVEDEAEDEDIFGDVFAIANVVVERKSRISCVCLASSSGVIWRDARA